MLVFCISCTYQIHYHLSTLIPYCALTTFNISGSVKQLYHKFWRSVLWYEQLFLRYAYTLIFNILHRILDISSIYQRKNISVFRIENRIVIKCTKHTQKHNKQSNHIEYVNSRAQFTHTLQEMSNVSVALILRDSFLWSLLLLFLCNSEDITLCPSISQKSFLWLFVNNSTCTICQLPGCLDWTFYDNN